MDHAHAQKGSIVHVWKADDDWTGLQELEQRKKRQNRLNQRAYRKRNAQKEPSARPGRPFQVDRFRLVDVPATHPKKAPKDRIESDIQGNEIVPVKPAVQKGLESLARKQSWEPISRSGIGGNLILDPRNTPTPLGYEPVVIGEDLIILMPPLPSFAIEGGSTYQQLETVDKFTSGLDSLTTFPTFEGTIGTQTPVFHFPLSSDHLLHLIHHNVFRALITNKVVLSSATSMSRKTREEEGITPSFVDLCDGFTIIHSNPGQLLPSALNPTYNQMTIGHSSWFNMFPHPRIRDNLILHEGKFDPYDFCYDIFGEMIDARKATSPRTLGFVEETEDDITNGRRGLIIWGEPWDVEGWEVMPGFLRKWAWVLEGCEDLITASNRWRAKRDEDPLSPLF